MAHQTRGFCKYCGKEYTRGGMLRHLAACKERKAVIEKENGKRRCGYFELVLCGKYDSDYWLIIEVRDTAALSDLDQFIRDIWVECCGHLSAFEIAGEEYESMPDTDCLWGTPGKSMKYKLKDVLAVGMLIGYEYDFGSTTELVIKVQGYRTGVWKQEEITILSRNNPPEFVCSICGKNKAKWILPELYYRGDVFRCEECLEAGGESDAGSGDFEDEDFDEYYLPVCNSPRMGVCGYEGSECFSDRFEPDKVQK